MRQFATRFTDEELTEDNHEEILYLLTQYKNDSNIQYESLGYITLSGNKYLTDLSEFNVSDRSYFKELQDSQKDVVISDVIASKSNEEQIVLIVSKVYDKDKNVKGYISAALKTEYISNLITNIAKDFHVYITNSNGNVVLGDTKVVADGTRYEKNLISNPNWTYVLEIPSSYYMNTILETIALITIVTVLIILITLLLVQKIVTEFVSPL
ncbi:cache domain-containing protein [Solobacterium moorei]|uniref:PDC sensor domain-containing protein n=1 Tax=Solobacterium moorei TaxID=102148 RepID=UPI0028E3D1BE|nr:cache domain-containing protein [Solobacterium moorei]